MDVFINCPFDDKYKDMLRPLLFTVLFLGHNPRIAFEDTDCSYNRLSKIRSLIKATSVSIHDLSRMKSLKKNEFVRFNLPFELGLDIACKYSVSRCKAKKLLILETNRFDYLRSISDIAGFDIKAHFNLPDKIVEVTRDWFVGNGLSSTKKSPKFIFTQFTLCYYELRVKWIAAGYAEDTIQDIPLIEFLRDVNNWIEDNISNDV